MLYYSRIIKVNSCQRRHHIYYLGRLRRRQNLCRHPQKRCASITVGIELVLEAILASGAALLPTALGVGLRRPAGLLARLPAGRETQAVEARIFKAATTFAIRAPGGGYVHESRPQTDPRPAGRLPGSRV